MNPFHLTTTVSRPREEVFNYLADIANHAEFSGHYLTDWHLTRIDSVGQGAGARFHINAPLNRFSWGDVTFVDVQPPFRIVAIGRTGKFNRIKTYARWTLSEAPGGSTRIEYEAETEPILPTDRIIDGLGAPRARRAAKRALRRLKLILEGDVKPSGRVTVAGL